MKLNTIALITAACLIAEFAPNRATAGGNHYGWCRGVGNPHQSSQGCGQTGGQGTGNQVTGPTQPTANQLPPKGTQKTPTSVAVPVLAPGAIPTAVPGQVPIATPIAVPGQVPPLVISPQLTPPQVPTPTPNQVPTAVPGQVPQLQPQVTSPQLTPPQVPTPTPNQIPVAVPGQVPQLQPQLTPQQVPTPTPNQVPVAVPGQVPSLASRPTATHVAVPGQPKPQGVVTIMRPKPRPLKGTVSQTGTKQVSHHQTHQTNAKKHDHVAATPGRHDAHDLPRFRSADANEEWECVASGFGQRKYDAGRGILLNSGALRHLGNVDAMARDVPARHPKHSGCIISVKRKRK
ncbi:MAG: hypothetical protein ACR2O2_05725 [Ruegeria sp.]